MKAIIITAIILLLSAQVQATGFYQAIVGETPQQHSNYTTEHEFSYSPLYEKVIGHHPDFVADPGSRVDYFSYTPLYLKVLGHPVQESSRIAVRQPANDGNS